MTAIQKQYEFKQLKLNKAIHESHEKVHELREEFNFCVGGYLLGIEIEVENVKNNTGGPPLYWTSKKDGSLRNNGQEFTSIPLQAKQVPHAIEHLQDYLDTDELDFSPRTSVHMHLNVRDLTWDEVKTLILLYAMFERHFFHIAGTKRESSIYCVPLYKTDQLKALRTIETNTNKWHKYSALNVGTILGNDDVPRFGTIEFRHLYGTLNTAILYPWIDNILCLKKATKKYNYTQLVESLKTLNSTSEYIAMYQDVFGEYANLKAMNKYDFEHCITEIKQALFGDDVSKDITYNSAFHSYMQSMFKEKQQTLIAHGVEYVLPTGQLGF